MLSNRLLKINPLQNTQFKIYLILWGENSPFGMIISTQIPQEMLSSAVIPVTHCSALYCGDLKNGIKIGINSKMTKVNLYVTSHNMSLRRPIAILVVEN